MATANQTRKTSPVTQEHCIDLPGETVQCWVGSGTDKLKVILRKHRDVVFDLKLGNGKTYTVESTESDFYNARDKKIVFAARRTPVTFSDGERLHLWVSRGFRGALIVKCDKKIVAKVAPNEWDQHQYGGDPKEKPAPIIISMGKDVPIARPAIPVATQKKTVTAQAAQPSHSPSPSPATPRLASAPVHEETCPLVCVVDADSKNIPADVLQAMKKGGDGSGYSKIDPNHVLTRNWIWGAVAGGMAYVDDNWEWLRASVDGKTHTGFRFVSAKIHYVRGKVRFYFSGFSNANKVFGRGGFGPGNQKIMSIFSGVGKSSSSFKAVAAGIAGTFKGNALVSFIFGSVTAWAEWKDDVKKDGYDLAAGILMSVLKAILSAAIVVLIVAGIVLMVMVAIGGSLTVLALGVISLVFSFIVGYFVEAGDKAIGQKITGDENNNDGLSSVIAPWLRKAGQVISENFEYLKSKMPKDYSEISFEGP